MHHTADPETWFKTEIEELADMRSYDVKTEDGRILHRNHGYLCRSREPFYSSQPREAPVALQVRIWQPRQRNSKDLSQYRVSLSQQCQLRETSLNSLPKPLLHYLPRPNLYAQHLTSLSQLIIGSLELWPVS